MHINKNYFKSLINQFGDSAYKLVLIEDYDFYYDGDDNFQGIDTWFVEPSNNDEVFNTFDYEELNLGVKLRLK